jgi:hypothetical protein
LILKSAQIFDEKAEYFQINIDNSSTNGPSDTTEILEDNKNIMEDLSLDSLSFRQTGHVLHVLLLIEHTLLKLLS